MMQKNAKIYIAGHRGMVGSAILRNLQARGYTNIVTRTHQELDLINQAAVDQFFEQEKADYVFLAAAKVGGIQANNTYRADFIYQNMMIEANIIHAAHKADVNRLLFLGSSCIYPRDCPQPIKEEYLLTGPLEQTNEPYAIAKIAGIKLCESYNRQYGRQYISAMPTNLYGPNDNYDLNNSHVLPALIRKVHLAKLGMEGDIDGIRRDEKKYGNIPENILNSLGCERDSSSAIVRSASHPAQKELWVWGTGTPKREFLYVEDLADACIHLMETGYNGPLLNVGTGVDITICELANTIMEVINFRGEIVFDADKPDGTPKKLLDCSAVGKTGWSAKTLFADGIRLVYAEYVSKS